MNWTILSIDAALTAKLAIAVVLYLFLPFSALSYYFFRRHRREAEIKRILSILNFDADYKKAYEDVNSGLYFSVDRLLCLARGLPGAEEEARSS